MMDKWKVELIKEKKKCSFIRRYYHVTLFCQDCGRHLIIKHYSDRPEGYLPEEYSGILDSVHFMVIYTNHEGWENGDMPPQVICPDCGKRYNEVKKQ